jgi:ABC-type transport system substrate-binding protein
MNGRWRLVGAAAALAIGAAACTGSSPPRPPPSPSPARVPEIPLGGTLRTQMVSDVSAAFDPQKEWYSVTFGLYRCCLLRTLLATNGLDAQHGGNELHPDLAASLPTVSKDGLTWTFHLKRNIHYAPPLQDLTVTAFDFVRALKREACADCATGGYSFYYGGGPLGAGIVGFDDYATGKAHMISGLSAPNDSTLVVNLEHPAGDLGWRFALAATAPIPPNPANASAPLGVATGHTQDYGRFLATTGPYMFEGQDIVQYTANAKGEKPIPGYRPGRSISFVRNPSWSAAGDPLRAAYLDGIDIIVGGTPEDVAKKVDSGELDLGLDHTPPPDQLTAYATDPDKKQYLHANPSDGVRYLTFNMAIPPFDDVHIRKAVNFAVDKDAMRRLKGGPPVGKIATHAIPDTLETIAGRALLADFDPYATPDHAGDLAKAQAEMRLSKYDPDGDGVCDVPECKDVLTVTSEGDPYTDQLSLIEENLEPLGITLNFPRFERTTMYTKCDDPAARVAFCLYPGWFKDYPDAFTWSPTLSSGGIYPNCCNYGLLGASRGLLEKYHYSVTSVPSVDSDIARCDPLMGDARIRCWADLDRKIMTEIVPWVPYLFDVNVDITSKRLLNYTFDSFAGMASLDHLALARQ